MGWEVQVALFYAGGPLEMDLVESGVEVHQLGKRSRYDMVRPLFRLVRLLRTNKIPFVYSFLTTPGLAAVAAKPFVPGLKVIWGVGAATVDRHHYGLFAELTFFLSRCLSPLTELILVNSKAGRSYHVRRGYPEQKTIVVPNGIDTELFRRDEQGRLLYRNMWGVSSDEILVGLVSQLRTIKDHPTFLKAASLVAEQRKGAKFCCVGGGSESYLDELRELSRTLGIEDRVIWAGEVSAGAGMFSAFDLGCSSSISEGISNSVAEAMACEVPCVVTDAGDSAVIVGDSGIVVPVGDHQSLAQGMLRMIERIEHDPALGTKARERIVARLGLSSLAEATIAAMKGPR